MYVEIGFCGCRGFVGGFVVVGGSFDAQCDISLAGPQTPLAGPQTLLALRSLWLTLRSLQMTLRPLLTSSQISPTSPLAELQTPGPLCQ